METIKCKVVMLPHNKQVIAPAAGKYITMLSVYQSRNYDRILSYERYMDGVMVPNPQHLYLISDREIQVGDWFWNTISNTIHKATHIENNIQSGKNHGEYHGKFECQKVEAITDPVLNLPLIPASFVEKYAEKQGKIGEVLIETDEKMVWRTNDDEVNQLHVFIRTRSDGTVIIHKLKDSWNREELRVACWEAWKESDQRNSTFQSWFDKNY